MAREMSILSTLGEFLRTQGEVLRGCFRTRMRAREIQEPKIPADMDVRAQKRIMDLFKRTGNKIDDFTSEMIIVSAVDTVVDKLQSGRNWVTITGNAGDGKTTLAYLLLNHIRKNIIVYEIEEPEEYELLSMFNEDRVIMFDDRFGAFSSDHVLIDKWKGVINDIHRRFDRDATQTKVIFVSRKNVVNEARLYLGHFQDTVLDPENVVDLSLLKNRDERLQILDYYLKQCKLKVNEGMKRRVAERDIAHGFPHCCKMYSKLKAKKHDLAIEDFFQTPLKFLDITTEYLYNESCKDLFDLMIENNGQFDVHSLQDHATRSSLLKVERDQEGSYIAVWKNGVCEFAHPSIYESVLSVICNIDPLFCVQHATLSVIRQKLTLISDKAKKSPIQINVEPVQPVLKALAERFRPEILKGDYSVFEHRICDNEDFCKALLDNCVTSDISHIGDREQISSEETVGDEDTASDFGEAPSVSVQDSSQQQITRPLTELDQLVHHISQDASSSPERGMVANTQFQLETTPETTRSSKYAVHQHTTLNVFGDVSVNADNIRNLTVGGQQYIHQSPVVQQKEGEKKRDGIQDQRHGSTPVSSGRMDGPHHNIIPLIKSKQHIDRPSKEGRTMLWTAVRGKRKSIIHELMEHGADVNILDESGTTLLLYLCKQDEVDIENVKLAISKGADCSKTDEAGNTALLNICKQNNIDNELVKILVSEGGPDCTNKKDRSGMAALHYLCGRRKVNVELIRFLVVEGRGNISLHDNIGGTPLHWLSGNSSCSVDDIQQLIILGQCDINKQDSFGFSPLHCLCARTADRKKLVSLIQEVGGDVNLTDKQGNTPLHFIHVRDKQSADYLLEKISGADGNKVNLYGISVKDHLTGKVNATQLFLPLTLDTPTQEPVRDGEWKWTPVLVPAMELNVVRVHQELKVVDQLRVLTNMEDSEFRNDPGQFLEFRGTCSNPIQIPPSLFLPPFYWETLSKLRWKKEGATLLEVGVVEGERNLDERGGVSGLRGYVCVSLWGLCSNHPESLCIAVWRRDQQEKREKQVGECVTMSLPSPDEEFSVTFGLVLDMVRGKVGFIDVEREKLLCKVDLMFRRMVFPMFHVDPDSTFCETRLRLLSGSEISVNDRKKQLIQQALSN